MFVLECNIEKIYGGYIIPLLENDISIDKSLINEDVYKSVCQIINTSNIKLSEQPQLFTIVTANRISKIVIYYVKKQDNLRAQFMQMSSALKALKGEHVEEVSILLGNTQNIYNDTAVMQKMFEAPALVYYNFDAYFGTKAPQPPKVSFALSDSQKENGAEQAAKLAEVVSSGTLLARELVNRPSNYMTPDKLAQCAVEAGEEAGFITEVFDKQQIEKIGMKSLLAVSAGAHNPPRFIVMRYNGASEDSPLIALAGKGITFDSGGYSLKEKSGMASMHTDMSGAAAVIGTMYAIAKQGIKLNVIGLVPACENLIGPNATLPGSVIGSLLGRTTEVVSTDGEGRLILCDALTYAVQNEGAEVLIDIATLTGSASLAVGTKTSVVITEDEKLFKLSKKASQVSCEKTWRLDLDDELRPMLKSFYADSKNTPSSVKHGGTILAALFLKPFTLGKRWMHIDMAPVAWVTSDELPYSPKGATGYGVALLSAILRQMEKGDL